MSDVLFASNVRFETDLQFDPRLAASRARLARDDYATSRVIAESLASDWPGDLAGRLLLTTSRFVAAGAQTGATVTELFEAILDALRPRGYFGDPPVEFIDEQQVACHGWVASALIQYGLAFEDARGVKAASRAVDTLILPALAQLDSYPRTRIPSGGGDPSGTAVRTTNGWQLSSDTFCFLLCLNALVPLFEATRRTDVASAITRLIEFIDDVDLVEAQAQLHASLAAARNLARYAELTGDSRAARVAVEVYNDYATHGRTLNWATYNWFGRPDSWTEPCAVVDSIGLAFSLWRLTKDPAYLEDVGRIEHNAMSFAERPDGSFGLDTVATDESPFISPIHPDARWCCTMRGGLGLTDLRDRSYFFERNELHVLLPRAGRLSLASGIGETWQLSVKTAYPATGEVTIRVESAPESATPITIAYAPAKMRIGTLPPVQGASITFHVAIDRATIRLRTGHDLLFAGPELLVDIEGTRYRMSSLTRDLTEPPPTYCLAHPPQPRWAP